MAPTLRPPYLSLKNIAPDSISNLDVDTTQHSSSMKLYLATYLVHIVMDICVRVITTS